MANVGRNEPCPCGSGAKFKKCCGGGSAVVELPVEGRKAKDLHDLDRKLVDDLFLFATKRLGAQWLPNVLDDYFGDYERDEYEMSLFLSWAIYDYENEDFEEMTVAQIYRAEQNQDVTPEVSAWLDSQDACWLSVWEVRDVEPGSGIALRDRLSQTERFVHEVTASQSLKPKDCVLARVVDAAGLSVLCGLHPRVLSPMEAEAAVRAARRACDVSVNARNVPHQRLHDIEVQHTLIDGWHESVQTLDQPKALPKFANTDGDPLLMTTDHFEFDAANREAIVKAIQRIDEAQETVEQTGQVVVHFLKPGNAKIKSWDNTVIGRAVVGQERLNVETNSMKRADDLRQRLEAGLGSLVRHRLRDHSDMEPMLKSTSPGAAPPMEKTPELKAMLRDFMDRYMNQWLDEEIPALGGLTPREAMKKPESREKLDLLLRDMEHRKSGIPADEQPDFAKLRQQLGLQ